MDNPAQPRSSRAQAGEQLCHTLFARHVGPLVKYDRAVRAQVFKRLSRYGTRGAASADQHQLARAPRRQPPGDVKTERTETACDQVCAVGRDLRPPVAGRGEFCQARHPPLAVAESNLVFPVSSDDLRQQRRGFVSGPRRVEIKAAARQPLLLQQHALAETPQRRLGQTVRARAASYHYRAARHEPEAGQLAGGGLNQIKHRAASVPLAKLQLRVRESTGQRGIERPEKNRSLDSTVWGNFTQQSAEIFRRVRAQPPCAVGGNAVFGAFVCERATLALLFQQTRESFPDSTAVCKNQPPSAFAFEARSFPRLPFLLPDDSVKQAVQFAFGMIEVRQCLQNFGGQAESFVGKPAALFETPEQFFPRSAPHGG